MTRSRSRGDPQLEDGFLKVANELAEAMCRTIFSPNESRIIWYIMRRTYGFNKKSARVSGAEWEDGTGIKLTHIYRTLRKLVERNVVTMVGHKSSRKVGIQKNYKKWKTVTGRGLSDQVRSQLVTMVGHKRETKGCHSIIKDIKTTLKTGSCPQCGRPKKEEWHRVCDECYKNPSIAPDRYANLPDCPNCTTKSFTQIINQEVGGCNFCKPMEVE